MVEVFKTNIASKRDAKEVISGLKNILPLSFINIDLMDCDKVLRVEVNEEQLNEDEIIKLVNRLNFRCEILDY